MREQDGLKSYTAHELTGGEVVRLAWGHEFTTGQRVGAGRLWLKRGESRWVPAESPGRSMHSAREWLESCDDWNDVVEVFSLAAC